jgi:NodT family efflux transporter outer membrane factor (OMF) lipoprotein
MNVTKLRNIVILTASSLILTSCGVVTETYKKPEIIEPVQYRDIESADTVSLGALSWKEMFKDKCLQDLIEEGLKNNIDIKTAIARIQQSEAAFGQSKLALWPSLGAEITSTSKQKITSSNVSSSQNFGLSLYSSWEADIWGKLTSAKRASLAALLESKANRDAVITTLISEIAGQYYSLLALDAQLDITRKTIDIRIADVTVMKALETNAQVTGAAVVQSEASRYAAEVTIPDIQQNIRSVENSLSILLGRFPGPVKRSAITEQALPEKVQPGVPLQLLSSRPDVKKAEYAFRNAFELTNVARTYFYPSLTITASENTSAGKISELFNPMVILGNLAAGLTQPIFNQGANTARLESAKAQQEETLLAYRETVLNAAKEVSDALFSYQTGVTKAEVREKQIKALELSVEYTKQLLAYGTANYTEVLTAEQNLLSAELNRVNDKLQQLQACVSLYRSLGGGLK